MNDNNPRSRRATLKQGLALITATGILGIAAKASAQSAKAAPASVAYQTKPSGSSQCSNCVQFVAPNVCKIVSGDISPSGWCELWSPKSA
jgi:hypothetical protein